MACVDAFTIVPTNRPGEADPDASNGSATRYLELCHRVRNDLQKLGSSLARQSKTTGYRECSECISRVNAISELHRLLNHQTSDMLTVADYLGAITQSAQAAFDGLFTINAQFDAAAVLETDRTALVGLVLNEAILNASKHAFADGDKGKITTSFHREGTRFFLLVSDNGRGSAFTSREGGLGIRVMQAVAEQLEGTLSYPFSLQGTTVCLAFPIRPFAG